MLPGCWTARSYTEQLACAGGSHHLRQGRGVAITQATAHWQLRWGRLWIPSLQGKQLDAAHAVCMTACASLHHAVCALPAERCINVNPNGGERLARSPLEQAPWLHS